jgi:hypothetical protein
MRADQESLIDLMRENAKLRAMLRVCILELRILDAHTVPAQAENLLDELEH